MDFLFSRTEEQLAATVAAYNALQIAKQALVDTLSEISLHEYAMAQPNVCFDDSQPYGQERSDYEDAFGAIDFCVLDADGNLRSIAWVEMSSETLYEVWGYDDRGDEVCFGRFLLTASVYY